MSKTTAARSDATTGEQIAIHWKKIYVPGAQNIRSDLPVIERLAESLKVHGQLVPVVVTNGGSPDQPYTLVAGNRRMAAFELNHWQDREILAVVREYAKGDALSRIADNWTENIEREALSPLDQAHCMLQLVSGTYPVAEGEEAAPVPTEMICARFGLQKGHLGKLVKVARDINADLSDLARKHEAPLRLLIALSHIKGEGDEKLDREIDRAGKQGNVLQAWIDAQAALVAQDRQRAVRSDKGVKGKRGKKDEGPTWILKPTKRLDKRGTVEDYLSALRLKETARGLTRDERVRTGVLIEVFRWLSGDLKNLPGLVAADFEAVARAETEAKAAEKAAAAEGEEE